VSVSRAGRPLDERDRELLLFLAEHRVALETQVQMLLDVSAQTAERRLRALAARGFLARQRIFCGEPACCHIRSRGLAAVGSGLPTPRPKLAYYGHDIGLAWIWLAAKRGSLGPQREVSASAGCDRRTVGSAADRSCREPRPNIWLARVRAATSSMAAPRLAWRRGAVEVIDSTIRTCCS
jgi:hypothetical protein